MISSGYLSASAMASADLPDAVGPARHSARSITRARFVADAQRLVQAVQQRGHVPLLVGGTMLYFKALREGLDTMPEADATLRQAIEAEAAERGWPALHAELARVDAPTAARLAPADAQRVQRALEVFRLTGRPLSDWHRGRQPPDTAAWPLVTLEPTSRAWLHTRIAQRFDSMLAGGLLQEVQTLRGRGDLHADLPAMRCVGYRQAWLALDQGNTQGLRDAGIAATRQLAKRQLTWLRSMTDRSVIACDAGGAQEAALNILESSWHA